MTIKKYILLHINNDRPMYILQLSLANQPINQGQPINKQRSAGIYMLNKNTLYGEEKQFIC